MGVLALPGAPGTPEAIVGDTRAIVSVPSNSITPQSMLAYERSLPLTINDNIGNVMVMDPAGAFLLVGVRSSPGRITKVSLPDLTVQGVLTLQPGENDLGSGAIDATGQYAYFGTISSGHIVQVDATTMTRLSTVTLPAAAKYPSSAAMATDGRYLYIGNSRYWNSGWSPAQVARVDLDHFVDASVSAAAMEAGDRTLTSMVVGPDEHVYVGADTSPGRVLRVSTSALTREAVVSSSAGEDALLHAVTTPDRRQVFVSTNTSPSSRVWSFDLFAGATPGYATVSSLVLPDSVTQVASRVMDPFGHCIYVGSSNTPAQVAAVTASASATTAEVSGETPWDHGGLTVQGYAVEQAASHIGPWTPATGGCTLAVMRASTATTCTAAGLATQGYVFPRSGRTTRSNASNVSGGTDIFGSETGCEHTPRIGIATRR